MIERLSSNLKEASSVTVCWQLEMAQALRGRQISGCSEVKGRCQWPVPFGPGGAGVRVKLTSTGTWTRTSCRPFKFAYHCSSPRA